MSEGFFVNTQMEDNLSKHAEVKKITVNNIKNMKHKEKIVCLTAYDYTSAKIIDESGVDLILVGDSLGMVMNGYESTIPVTVDEIIYHTKSVKKGIKRAFLVADMPFGSYQISDEQALTNAVRIIKESGAEAIKLEGGKEFAPLVKKMVKMGINVMGHIGLMPQQVLAEGGYKIQGRHNEEKLIEDAIALEEAGVFSIVLEGVVDEVSKKITEKISIPTIGIGAGIHCDGQILVFQDIFGMFDDFVPKFVKQYANVGKIIKEAAMTYCKEVKSSEFPEDKHSFKR
ncbi:MAG: 3-methyl-2-oxobutanoate hydroxymethyltransferase [Deferribacteres bacterium]|nr:panB [Deferribacteraceae bacterium]MDK2791839.1 3-methyl-2-oxobutanoate hydroxymethyltransferase [Deferribacteres bacterium]